MADRREHFQEPLTTISTGQVTTNAGARVQLHVGLACVVVSVSALPGNTGNIALGNNAVTMANGRILGPGMSIDCAIDNVNRLYLDVAVNGEGISYMALL
jgi:hypothetical protein